MGSQTWQNGPVVLDRRQLRRLAEELGDPAGVDRFLGTFLVLLPPRMAEVAEAVRHGRPGPSDVAANLAAICQMIGADRLACHLLRLPQGNVAGWTTMARAEYVQEAYVEAGRLRRALMRYLEPGQHPRAGARKKAVAESGAQPTSATTGMPEFRLTWSGVG